MRGGDVEEAQFIGAGLVIGLGDLDGVARIAQVDEIDTLDDATILHIETGNDARLQHQAASAMSFRASAASRRPS